MVTQTDPARQYAEICEALSVGGSLSGDELLGKKFQVEPWSKAFWEIICYIIELSEDVLGIVDQLPLDEDFKNQAKLHIKQTKRAFTKEGLINVWDHACSNLLTQTHVSPIKILSGLVRPISSFPKFDAEEVDQIALELEELIGWLREHQLSDEDFIRQSLIAGLEKFHSKLLNFHILGWGCGVESIREVVAAYVILERGFPPESDNTLALAMTQKTGTFLKGVWEKVGVAKDFWETSDWVLRIAGAMQVIEQTPKSISGLLSG